MIRCPVDHDPRQAGRVGDLDGSGIRCHHCQPGRREAGVAIDRTVAAKRLDRCRPSGEQPPRIDRQPSADDPAEQEHPANKTADMVPQHPAAIRADAPCLISPLPRTQAQDADPYAGQGDRDAGAGHPHHHLTPRRIVLSQDRRIQPVRHRPQPVPDSLDACGALDRQAGCGRHIDDGARGIAERDPPQGAMPVEATGDGPLVAHDLICPDRTRSGKVRRHPPGIAMIDGRQHRARSCGHGIDDAVIPLDPPYRFGITHFQQQPPLPGRERRRHVDPRPVDRRRPGPARGRRQGWIGHVEHHQSRAEPHPEEQARRDPRPAMGEEQPA